VPTDLRRRSILITGAGAGLGRAYVRDLAERGATVIANDIDERALAAVVEESAALPGRVVGIATSIADWQGAADLVGGAFDAAGRLDAVVNNAGIFGTAPAVDETEEHIRATVEVNLLGSMFVGIHALRVFARAGDGLLLNTTSGAYLGLPGAGTYAATKGGIVSLSYCWAREMRGTGVRVNVLSPRALTRMSQVRGAAGSLGAQPPERIAPVLAALLSGPGREISGVVLSFDGVTLGVLDRPRPRELASREEPWTDEMFDEALGHVRR
jgi:NAD(P)-dependent dehydrogenase (short-subunit alcohol dehydrogenase family)